MAEILIVDDEQPIRTLLSKYLEGAGHGCHVAQDVATAKKILSGHAFDLILSDVTMPGESGVDLIRHVTAHYSDTPMIMVSVIDNPERAKEALELGVYGYIIKPFTRNIVLINVENALQRRHLEIEKRTYLDRLETVVQQRTETLQNQLIFMQDLIDAIPSPIFYKNKDKTFNGCNTAFERLTGLSRESIVGRRALDVLPKDFAAIAETTDGQLFATPEAITFEYDMIAPDQKTHNLLVNKAVYKNAKGEVAGQVGVMVDITERKATEDALRVSEEKFRQIAENIGIGITMVNPELEVLWMNKQMADWHPELDLNTKPICHQEFIRPPRNSPCNNCPTLRALKEGKRFEATTTNRANVNKKIYRIIASPIHDNDGKVIAAIELVENITERIAMERDLRQAQKLESIGQLAAGIAHEINTPTQYIGDNARFLQEADDDLLAVLTAYAGLLDAAKTGAPLGDHITAVERQIEAADLEYLLEEIPQAIEQTLEGVSRVSKIVTSMRQFSHPGTGKKTPVDLNKALEATITVARNEWKYVADLHRDFDNRLPMVNCLPGEINQVLLNLLINAAQAIGQISDNGKKGKGKIGITTEKDNGWARISISDTGGGIPESIHQRIFDPFFTTKAVGKGTGQGLAIAHRVITENHKGTITFDTEAGHGTTFTVKLPLEGAGEPDKEKCHAG